MSALWSNYMSTTRPFWFFVYYAFNRIESDRVRQFGPDRACAEWILRNGGAISECGDPGTLITNYNDLPPARRYSSDTNRFRVHSIVADNIGILAMGFDHLQGCQRVERIVLRNCAHLENDALDRFGLVMQSLRHVEVFGCRNIRVDGLLALGKLERLQSLRLGSLLGVRDLKSVAEALKRYRPQCTVEMVTTK